MEKLIIEHCESERIKKRLLDLHYALKTHEDFWFGRESAKVTANKLMKFSCQLQSIVFAFTTKGDDPAKLANLIGFYYALEEYTPDDISKIFRLPLMKHADESTVTELKNARDKAKGAWIWLKANFDSSMFKEKFPDAFVIYEKHAL